MSKGANGRVQRARFQGILYLVSGLPNGRSAPRAAARAMALRDRARRCFARTIFGISVSYTLFGCSVSTLLYPDSGLWTLDTGFRVPFPLIARPSLRHELGSVQRVVGSLVVAIGFGLVGLQNLPEFTLAAHFVPVFGVVAALILLASLFVEGVVGARGVGFVVLHPQTLPVSGKTHNPIIFFSEVDIYSRTRVQKVGPHP